MQLPLRRFWLQHRPHAAVDLYYVARDWGWSFAANLEWHRRVYLPRILMSPPMDLEESSDIEVHLLVNRSRSLEGIWTAKSFYWKSQKRYTLVVHDDGSLTRSDFRLWKKHFPRSHFIWRSDSDRAINQTLIPSLTRIRQWRTQFPTSMKLVDVKLLAKGKMAIVLDTDVLFAACPSELIATAESRQPGAACYNADCAESYSLPRKQLEDMFGVPVAKNLNCGVLAFDLGVIDLNRIEQYMDKSVKQGTDRPWFLDHQKGWFLEQTLYAVEFGRINADALPDTYMVGQLPEPPGIVCGHYCTRARLDMYRSAYPRLWKQFTEELNVAAKKVSSIKVSGA